MYHNFNASNFFIRDSLNSKRDMSFQNLLYFQYNYIINRVQYLSTNFVY